LNDPRYLGGDSDLKTFFNDEFRKQILRARGTSMNYVGCSNVPYCLTQYSPIRFDYNPHPFLKLVMNILEELLSTTHQYYPVGYPDLYDNYEGVKQLHRITSEKISQLDVNKNIPYVDLLKNLRDKYPNYLINDFSYYYFPSYQIEIDIEANLIGDIQFSRRIILTISLLIKNYTIFINDKYVFDGLTEIKKQPNILDCCEIIYRESSNQAQVLDVVNSLIMDVKLFFTDYEFIDHYTLFNGRVKACRSLVDLSSDYGDHFCNFYDLLFSIDKCRIANIQVLH
jgi:hypothetical protein